MKVWQRTVLNHHPAAEVLNDKQMKIPNIAWIPETQEYFDHVLTWDRNHQQLIVDEYKHNTNKLTNTEIETDIYNYLGY